MVRSTRKWEFSIHEKSLNMLLAVRSFKAHLNNIIQQKLFLVTFTAFGDVVTGDSNGNIILWGRGTNNIGKFVKKVHEGSVFSLCALRNGKLVSGGGKDGRLVLLGEDLMPEGMENFIEPHFGAVRVVTQGKGMQMLVGTTRNCILSGDLSMGFTPVVMGHTDELWGLAVHPNMPQFVTGGQDRLLQVCFNFNKFSITHKNIF